MTPKFFHKLGAFSALGFLTVLLLWPTVWVPSRLGTLLAVICAIPGLLALPGLLRGKIYTHAWTTLLSTLYVAYCASEAYANAAARAPALLAGCLAACWFVSSNLYVRGSRHRKAAAPADQA